MSLSFLTAARPHVPFRPLTGRRAAALFLDDRGAATAEYAIATMAAVAFAGLLVVIMRAEPTNSARAPSLLPGPSLPPPQKAAHEHRPCGEGRRIIKHAV